MSCVDVQVRLKSHLFGTKGEIYFKWIFVQADLEPDVYELMNSAHLEDKQLFFLQVRDKGFVLLMCFDPYSHMGKGGGFPPAEGQKPTPYPKAENWLPSKKIFYSSPL